MLADRYRIVALLGRGGMGQVYRAEDLRLGQAVALKFVSDAPNPRLWERLRAEVLVGRQVSHPNVCRLYDLDVAGGRTFLAMEYVDGEDLGSLLSRIGRLPPDKVVALARDLCAGLAALHERGVIHRDLKPANIMIDGRGRARITDFGLAVTQEGARAGEGFAGTPSYMSPEQLAGKRLDSRSDLYSLGLILFEMFTGERFYRARSIADLLREHEVSKSARISSSAALLPPAAASLIADCLRQAPEERPASARALLGALPGGDALDAAVAAGETPSPDQVAAAATQGELSPGLGWALVAAFCAGLVLVSALAGRSSVAGLAPPPRPPEVLAETARELLSRLGHPERGEDHANSFFWDEPMLEWIARVDASPDRWLRLGERPGAARFFYRTSPEPLAAANRHAVVLPGDPPVELPGMTELILDGDGRLLRYHYVYEAGEDPDREPDWITPLEAAGLGGADLAAASSTRPAPMDTDRKRSWVGALPGHPPLPVRVDAGAYRGRLVWFDVSLPWSDAPRARLARERSETPFGQGVGLLLAAAIPIGGVLLARHNLKLGRGDPEGASRVALFVFSVYGLARLVEADHVARFDIELWILIKVFAYPALWAGLVWMLYVALEPHVRRRWPQVLISWRRVLDGQLRNPMVGRDLLIGCVGGIVVLATEQLGVVGPTWFGEPSAPPSTLVRAAVFADVRHMAFRLLVNAYSATQFALIYLFLLVLLRIVVRRPWLAMAIWVVVVGAPMRDAYAEAEWVTGLMRAAGMLLVLHTGGLLALAGALYVGYTLLEAPLTLDFSTWHAGLALPATAVALGLAVYAFRTALGGKPLFGTALD
jgi:serine/threonine-protein kinase